MSMERNQSIDVAKGIGIVLVVWGHTTCPVKSEIFIFHMPLFYILSGYFFNVEKDFKETAKRKFRSLIVPYIFFFVFAELSFILLYALTGKSDQITLYPSILINPYGVLRPLWFLLSLFETTLIYFLICKMFKRELTRFVISLLLASVGYIFSQNKLALPFFIDSSISMVLFFNIGYLANKYNIFNYKGLYHKRLMTIIFALCYAYGVYKKIEVGIWNNTIDKNFLLYLLSAIGGSFLIIQLSDFLSKCFSFISQVLSFLGKESLIIFALHMLSFELARSFLGVPQLEDTTDVEGLYTLICGILLSILIGLPIKKYFPYIFK